MQSPKDQEQAKMPNLTTSIQHCTGGASQCNMKREDTEWGEGEIKCIKNMNR